MLARHRIVRRVGGQPVQAAPGEGVGAFMGASRAIGHLHEITAVARQRFEQIVHQVRINQRRVTGDAQQRARAR